MKNKYKKILLLYEDFRLHKGQLSGKEGFFDYQSTSSLHSSVSAFAYGIREKNSCVSLKNCNCESRVCLKNSDLKRRFYIKIKAQLFDWRKYAASICIDINKKRAYENENEFFENVNLGWPTVYIPVDADFLKKGENIIEITQNDNKTHLLVASVDLISLPEIEPGTQLTMKTAVRVDDIFALSFYSPSMNVESVEKNDCDILEIAPSPINCHHTIVKLKAWGKKLSLKLRIGDKEICAVMPEVYGKNDDVCLVGTDSDDHRHDESDESERIIEIFENTNLGNYWQARPQRGRNYIELADESVWEKRVEYMSKFNTKTGLSDGGNEMPYFAKMCGENFVGKHFHEAYLFFCAALKNSEYFKNELYIDIEALESSESFGQSKELFCEALRKMNLKSKTETGLTSVGSPSLLASYEAASGFDRVTIEPVSNINLLTAAVKGAASKMWGAHVPTDWYFGEPNDITKAKKYLLAMQYLYINGADYIYAENSLFKTNAFSREDWEDEFCSTCRKYTREFYEYTVKNPRNGIQKCDLAVLYGNNEYFMWHHDDRIAELDENGNWDITLWGKWKDNSHHKCWRAIDAWLPLSKNQKTKENPLNPKLFSGTPYGSVNVIPYKSDYSKYKALALLGWNTYEDKFGEKLYNYVENGGTAFVSYCHFNRTDRNDRPMEYASIENFGLRCDQIVTTSLNGAQINIVKTAADGEKFVTDENGNVLVWKKSIGKGTLYFATFSDYSCSDGKMEIMKFVLETMGKETANVICDNPNIAFTERIQKDGKTVIDVLNMCPASEKAEKYQLTFSDGRKISGKIKPCTIKTHQ